jgi:predicted nucleotidyltransferase
MAVIETTDLRSSLLAALAFFDIFNYPLTFAEIRRWRYGSSGLDDGPVEAALLTDLLSAPPIATDQGYYFLQGRQEIVATRQRRYRLAEDKFRKARRLARLARLLPSVRLIAVCNSLALSNADTESDIDLFIVCRPGTLWVTRLIIAGTLHLLGLRPTGNRHEDTFCLSFFLAENDLDISRLALSGGDVYLPYWIASLVPVYDAGGVLNSFFEANGWIKQQLPGIYCPESGSRRSLPPPRWNSWLLPLLGSGERAARRFQERRFPSDIAVLANRDSRVMTSEAILKFHVTDRRAIFQKSFVERCRALGLNT